MGFNAKQTFTFSNFGTYHNVSSIEAKRATPIGAKSAEDGALCPTLKSITIIINFDFVYNDDYVRHVFIQLCNMLLLYYIQAFQTGNY